MSHYHEVRDRIRRQMVPLPILFREDLSIDHRGLSRYVAWHLENGTRNLCLTFTYSQLDFITPEEIVAVTRTVQEVVRDQAVFISCTGGGPVSTAISTVAGIAKAGAPAAFVHLPEHCLQNSFQCGELYVRYIREVARSTDLPLLAVSLPVPMAAAGGPILTAERFADLCELEQFIGMKDDMGIIANRQALTRQFSGRMAIVGGGIFAHYLFFHHWPNQGEFAGIYNPRRGQRMFELLDANDYRQVLKMLEEDGQAQFLPPNLHWMARNQVVFYGMGFAETWLMRGPIVSATESEAAAILDHMRRHPRQFEHVAR